MANITEAEIRKIVENIIKGNTAATGAAWTSTEYGGRKLLGIYSDMNEAIYYIDAFNRIAEEEIFGFCLDIGHLLLLGLDTKTCMEKLGSRIKALHIHDNDGVDDLHLSPYLGVTDWERFLKGLIAIDYNGNLNFENCGSVKQVPPALIPSVLRNTTDIGNFFRARIEKTRAEKA